MKMIILAAGRGERLMPLTQNTPKPLIDVGNGNTLLEEQLNSIQESQAISEVVLVTGYLADQIQAKMRQYKDRGYRVTTLYNPFWQVSNNLLSLWLARHLIQQEDVMITNGDNLFSADVFAELKKQGEGIWLSACHKKQFDADDMKIKLTNGFVSRVSKQLTSDDAEAESPGLAMIQGERARRVFVEQLEDVVQTSDNNNRFWLEVFNHMWEKGIPISPWYFVAKGRWQEVDFHIDVALMRQLLQQKMASLTNEITS